MKTILNKKIVDTTSQPIFLGEDLSLQRYDKFKYPIFFKLYESQLEQFWKPNEYNLKKDRNDFKNLTDNEKFVFTSNLKYQTLMDSVIARGIPTLLEYVSLPEVECCLFAWNSFETIHSFSYSYIINNVYSNPSEILDSILKDEEILKRAISSSQEYDKLKFIKGGEKEIRRQIYLTIISINILEGIRFYSSFVTAFNFAENKKMIGNSDIIKAIRKDENLHLAITQNLIKILRDEKSEGFQQTIKECEEDAIKLFDSGSKEEKDWAAYLFKDGSLLGLNYEVLSQYIEWLTDNRMAALGLPKLYNQKNNPMKGWLRNYLDDESVATAPQESDVGSQYRIAAYENNIEECDLSEFL